MPKQITALRTAACLILALSCASPAAFAQSTLNVEDALLAETGQKTPEVTTAAVRKALADGSIPVIDARKRSEFVAGHIAGAIPLGAPPGATMPAQIAAMEALLGGDKTKPAILYCNGPKCQASRMLANALADAGFTQISRYQLGLPIWRALNGAVEIEKDGIVRIFDVDNTVVYFDGRDPAEFAKGSIKGAHNVPVSGLKDGQPLSAPFPNTDFNTRIVLFGKDKAQARALSDAVTKTSYTNVSYFPGDYAELEAALAGR
jgi:rhodanese-related sulfurtransferase